MNKIAAKTVLWTLGVFAVLLWLLPFIMSLAFFNSQGDSWEAMKAEKMLCPEGYEVTTRGWSEAGYMRYCEPHKHGPWEAWSQGRMQVKGTYQNGKLHGIWQWFDSDGNVSKTATYELGSEVEGN